MKYIIGAILLGTIFYIMFEILGLGVIICIGFAMIIMSLSRIEENINKK
jgi:hypothetical protein